MTSSPSSAPSSRTPLQELYTGRVPWQTLRDFPEPSPLDEARANQVIASLTVLLRERVDPERIERAGELPDGLLDALRKGGYLNLLIDEELSGLGLSPYEASRVIEVAASWCMPVGFLLAITNGFGSGTYLPLLPDGPLRDMIADRVREGVVSAGADAEAIGTANQRRSTTAVPVDGGTHFEITGEKVFIYNGTIAQLMDVSAALDDQVRLLFVSSDTPGFEVVGQQQFMGLRGAPLGHLRLDRVRVPASHLLPDAEDGWRMRPSARLADAKATSGSGAFQPTDLGQHAALGRMLAIGPASLAVARLCLLWSREFANRRLIDNQPLGAYEEAQRHIAETAAEVFTIESILMWVLHSHTLGDNQPELTAAKNLTSRACWRTVDRTVSLLGAEGYETAASKARRGVPALPVERCFRDARALRISGGVDFMLDRWSAEAALRTCWFNAPAPEAAADLTTPPLSQDCKDHLTFTRLQALRLARTCKHLTQGRTPAAVFRDQRRTAILGRIGNELLSMSIVLARVANMDVNDQKASYPLADLSCRASRARLVGLWHELSEASPSRALAYLDTATTWLNGTALDFLSRDVIADVPPIELPEEPGRDAGSR
ncbi:acyl-CoA dehydrogenase family protein [Streptomyces virginiae]|uniref:acyl-CoA dehydrogenase family protein n=1 Tax=Streptomyces virginiae TaxID=1961 RepID=UPI00099B7AE8|nr:acyl-CoA dehydrogenase family protein [Streptomyces virginiae]